MLLVFVVLAVLPATAARRVTVEQLEQSLAADEATHRPDALVARQLADLELSERLTDATLNRFASRFSLQPRTALALQLLSDQSVLLDPPASELPATALPDPAAQQRMLDLARGYAVEGSSHLPDFFVTRVTNRFDDSPQVLEAGGWPVRAGLHAVGSSSRQVTFREGREVQDPTTQTASSGEKTPGEIGLHTWGEFGPALSVVITDTARGTVSFSHWEQAATGLVAVYKYEVPRAASHYSVSYCCHSEEHVVGRTQYGYSGRNRSQQQVANTPSREEARPYIEVPAYKGELSIDPASGAVIRITLDADLKSGGPLTRATTMVEYGPIRIGDRSFILPVRSLAQSAQAVRDINHDRLLMLNETRFSSYHRLGTTMRIVNDAAGASDTRQTFRPRCPASARNSSAIAVSQSPRAGIGSRRRACAGSRSRCTPSPSASPR